MERLTRTGAILLADARGVYAVWRCDWLVRVATGHPEPDSFADTFRDIPCGHIMRQVDGYPTCDGGHVRYPYDGRHEDTMADSEDIGPWNSLAHIG